MLEISVFNFNQNMNRSMIIQKGKGRNLKKTWVSYMIFMSLLQQLEKIDQDLRNQASELSTIEEINTLKEMFFGKKGKISDVMKNIRDVSAEEKPLIGKEVNELKQKYLSSFDEKIKNIENNALNEQLLSESFDITLPGNRPSIGYAHPIKKAEEELVKICEMMGFSVAVAQSLKMNYNFEALIFLTHIHLEICMTHFIFLISNY